MSLKSVFDSIEPEMRRRLGDGFRFVDSRDADENGKPPFMSWKPTTSTRSTPGQTGAGPGDRSMILSRRWNVLIRAWGDTFADTENLVDTFLRVIHDQWTAYSYDPNGSEEWKLGGVLPLGAECFFQIGVTVPILRTRKPTRRISELTPSVFLDDEEVTE